MAALGTIFSAVVLAGPSAHASDTTVTITDAGFTPPTVNITVGDTVFWKNTGSKVHTATSRTGPAPFDAGGVSPGQTVSLNFSMA
ncbi:MAG TPA: hypothetical protein VKU60_15085, partial [Chloroflexota bacterium]|nr:hypothetical protein [Chloroflexota bacterium]